MIDLFETIIKTHTAVMMGEYFKHNQISDTAKGMLAAGLRTPSLGTWQLFSRELYKELKEAGHVFLCKDFDSGCDGWRFAVVTPTARRRPACTNATAAGIDVNTMFISPATVAVTAGPAPLYGTWLRLMVAPRMNSSAIKCVPLPLPAEPTL